MTNPRQAERERVAQKCIRDTEEVWNRVCHIDDETHAALVRNITNLLKATEAAVLEEAAQHVLNGSFLHDQAPTAMFAKEVAAMLRRKAKERQS